MSKTSNPKSVTMVGGKNVAERIPPRQKPPKADTTEPEEQTPPANPSTQEPTE